MNDQQIEKEIQAKNLNAPRITPQYIEEIIRGEDYYIFPGTTLTVCCLTLENGFNVLGESACASHSNFDVAIGNQIARDNAKQKIWALEGYILRDKLSRHLI